MSGGTGTGSNSITGFCPTPFCFRVLEDTSLFVIGRTSGQAPRCWLRDGLTGYASEITPKDWEKLCNGRTIEFLDLMLI